MTPLLLSLILLALGLVLMVAEHALPTAGALGILAVVCLAMVLYRGFSDSMEAGIAFMVAEVVLVPSTYAAGSYLIARTALGRVTTLRPPEPGEMDVSHASADLGRLVGERGRAMTTLRPSGMVDFEGRRLDGIAEEGHIATGSEVLAVRVRSGRLVVRADPGQ